MPYVDAPASQPLDWRTNLRHAYRLACVHRAWITRCYAITLALSVGMTALAGEKVGPTILSMCLTLSVITDLLWKRILNGVIGTSLVVTLFAGAIGLNGLPSFLSMLTGCGACFGVMFALHLVCRGGAGDVKMMAVVGALLGWQTGLTSVMLGYLIAAVAAAILLVGRAIGATSGPFAVRTMPMAPFIALGVLLALRG